jgi:pimeloyl-ACP methyl ester carboxylesterase
MTYPERVHTLTSLSTPHPRALVRSMVSSSQALHSWYIFFFQLPLLADYMAVGPNRRFFKRTLVKSGLAPEKVDYYLSVIGQPKALRACINWYRAVPFSARGITPVTVPTMYVYSTGDFALGRKAADLTEHYVSGPYRYEVLDGVSHWIPEEVPDVVSGLVLEHVKSDAAS